MPYSVFDAIDRDKTQHGPGEVGEIVKMSGFFKGRTRSFLSPLLSLDDPGKHHMMLRADGNGVLIGAARKGRDVFSQHGE
jgi:hypothetical protein